MFCRRRTTTAPLAVWTACACLSLSVGCTGSRFQLANRDDTPYAKDLAANDVRVPVNNGSNDSLLADGPRVPYDRNDRERFAANIPAEPTYPDGPLGAPSSVPPPLPLASQAGGPLPANRSLPMSNPYGPMVGMAAGVDGSEIAGRVVTDRGQPAPRIAVQATDPAQPGRILAEGATDENGLFRFRQLPAGATILVSAVGQALDGRQIGSVTTRVPDSQVVLQLQPENLLSGRTPLGNRLGSQAPLDLPRTTPAAPVSLSGGAIGNSNVAISTVQPITGGVATVAPTFAATGQPMGRVLPPTPRSSDRSSDSPAERETTNIDWDAPAIGSSPLPAKAPENDPPRESKPASSLPLDLPADGDLKLPASKDLQLDDFSVSPVPSKGSTRATPTSSGGGSTRSKLAFAGTGLEYARVYDLDGNKQPVGALASDLILLDFFGSWCGPCRRAIPAINELNDRYASMGLHVVGVACEYGQTSAALRAADDAVRQFGIKYPVIVSPMDEASELRDHFQVSAYPTVVLVDRSGQVYFKGEGGDAQSLRQLDAAIQRALAGSRVAVK
jgi:thiol-disulfide isomerase/thioredoxin